MNKLRSAPQYYSGMLILILLLVTILLFLSSDLTISFAQPSATKTLVNGSNKIVFASAQWWGHFAIYTIDVNGNNLQKLTSYNNPVPALAYHGQPIWSPDGKSIAYEADMGEQHGAIYVMDADGKHAHALTNHTTTDMEPAWSPAGEHILFISNRDGNWQIYVMVTDGTHQKRISYNSYIDENPTWSPDGNYIAFDSNQNGGSGDSYSIWLMDANGEHRHQLTVNIQSDFRPSWSPDGGYIVFESNVRQIDSGWDNGGIFRMESDGSHVTLIGHGHFPSWSSDGSQIMFVDGGSISFTDKNGTPITHVLGYLLPEHPSLRP